MHWGIISNIGNFEPSRRLQLGIALATVVVGGSLRLHSIWHRYHHRRPLSSRQVIAITGCDTGLGYSLALHCREKGATVFAGVLQPDGPGASDLDKHGVRVIGLDLTKDASIQNFVDELQKMIDDDANLELRAFVNNAGVMIFGEFEWQAARQIRHQVEVNLLGTMSITKQMLPQIRKHQCRIINVTSHCALDSLPGVAVYSATKAALKAWSDALRVELKKHNVKVVNFIPGSFAMQSNILTQQSRHFEEMRSVMTREVRDFYGDYFERYIGYLSTVSKDHSLCRLTDSRLYDKFDDALLTNRPSSVYKCEPWRYTYYYTLMKYMPTSIRDKLVFKFMKMPKWKKGIDGVRPKLRIQNYSS